MCDLQGSEPNHPREDAESGSSLPPSTGFGETRGRVRSRPPEGPRAGGELPLAGQLSHPSWPCTAARRTARSPRTSAVARFGTFARPSPVGTTTSHRFVHPKNALPSRVTCLESTPGRHVVAPIGNGLPPPLHVPPSWFSTTSTVSSSRPLRGCCTALPTVGFGGASLLAKTSRRRCPPFEAFPPPVAADRHRDACAPRSPTGSPFPAFPRHRAPRPAAVADDRSSCPSRVGSQGLAPPAGPLTTAAFPPRPSRCSHGLA